MLSQYYSLDLYPKEGYVTCIFNAVIILKYLWCCNTVMHHLTMGIRSEKRAVRQIHRHANVMECTYTNQDSITYYTPRLYGIAYCC